jgi:hypothetical protein
MDCPRVQWLSIRKHVAEDRFGMSGPELERVAPCERGERDRVVERSPALRESTAGAADPPRRRSRRGVVARSAFRGKVRLEAVQAAHGGDAVAAIISGRVAVPG